MLARERVREIGKIRMYRAYALKLLIERVLTAGEERVAALVHACALDIQHIIVRKHVLARVEIDFLDARLRLLELLRHHGIVQRLVLGDAEGAHHLLEEIRREYAHQRIFERNEKLRLTRISLAAGSPAQLIVRPARIVPLGAEHEEPACGLYRFHVCRCRWISTELDVHAAASHVGGYGDPAALARLCDDLAFASFRGVAVLDILASE